MKVAVVKPGIADANGPFEAMAGLYEYCQREHGVDVGLFVEPEDTFRSDTLTQTRIKPTRAPVLLQRLGVPGLPVYPGLARTLAAFDVIVSMDPFIYPATFLPGYIARRRSDCALVADVSLSFVPHRRGLKNHLWRWVASAWSQHVDAYIATTPNAVDRLRTLGVDAAVLERAEVLGHPVDTSRFRPEAPRGAARSNVSPDIVALTVGRLVPEKGQVALLHALAPVFAEHEGFSLKVIGGGPMESELRETVHRLELSGQVEVLGEVPHDDLPEHYRSADLFIGYPHTTPDWAEYFGVVYVEAMGSGLPIVTTRCGGIPHVVSHGETGLLVPEHDAEALRQAVRALITSPKRRRELGSNGRHRAETHFSIEALGERFYTICKKASERR